MIISDQHKWPAALTFCNGNMPWSNAFFLMILRVNRMIHVFRLHRKGREIAEFSPDTRLRMAGALNKQGRLLYFYGLGGGSGDGARVFGGGGETSAWGTWGEKRLPFPSWNGNSNEALRWPPITTTTTSTNSRWGEMSNSRHRASKEHGQHGEHHVLSMFFVSSSKATSSQSMCFSAFILTKIHSHLIQSLQGDTPLPVPRGFLFLHLETVYGWLHQGSDCSWDFHVCFREKDDLGSRGKKLYEWNFCL